MTYEPIRSPFSSGGCHEANRDNRHVAFGAGSPPRSPKDHAVPVHERERYNGCLIPGSSNFIGNWPSAGITDGPAVTVKLDPSTSYGADSISHVGDQGIWDGVAASPAPPPSNAQTGLSSTAQYLMKLNVLNAGAQP
jgi:hypothetical protein